MAVRDLAVVCACALDAFLTIAKEFHAQLKKLTDGDVSLVDKLGSVKLALQAAIANAFKTPEVRGDESSCFWLLLQQLVQKGLSPLQSRSAGNMSPATAVSPL